MLTNFHTHTYRCNHASGTEEEYILRAIEAGVGEMGFSDHGPYPMPNGYCSGFRMRTDTTGEYVATLAALRDKYREKIRIRIGFELEYYPKFFPDLSRHLAGFDFDYIIMGQHFIGNEIDNVGPHCTAGTEDEELLRIYVDQVCEGMRTGAYCYVAHPDVFTFLGDASVYDKHMIRLCETARELDIPLEINGLGIRTNRFYPHEAFWRLAGKVGNKAIFGCDAHDAPSAWDSASYAKAQAMAKTFGLDLVERPDFEAHDPKKIFANYR